MKPAAFFCLTAASNRATVSFTEYLLGLVIRPSSAACAVAGPVQIASESARLARARFLKLIGIPDLLLVWRRIELYGPHAVSSRAVYHRQDDAARPGIKFFRVYRRVGRWFA